jgi:hypothetical protein
VSKIAFCVQFEVLAVVLLIIQAVECDAMSLCHVEGILGNCNCNSCLNLEADI